MTDIKQIADEIYDKEKTKSYRDLINAYKKHKIAIEQTDFKSSDETYKIYSELIADYGIALTKTKCYKKAIPIINEALDLFTNNKQYSSDTLKDISFYEALLFNRGICNFNLYNYELAKTDFELLIKLYPDNSIYPTWKNEFKVKKLYRLRNVLWYIVSGSVLLEMLFEKQTLGKNIFLGVALVSLITSGVIELNIYIRKRKYPQ